jgi:glycosyltransferase involved in cell wall biosynthesis
MENQVLVSVVVVTYNSAGFVRETLDSIARQQYRNLEMIIADDASRDDTVAICREWVSKNEDRFVSVKVIADKPNEGLAGNCNRGLYAASGSWIKFIAGDDTLLENCISDYVSFVSQNEKVAVVFSNMRRMDKNARVIDVYKPHTAFFGYGPERQLVFLLYKNVLPAAAAFINRDVLVHEGGFDKTYPMMEDYPLWIKLLVAKYQFGYINKETVCYRIHDQSVSNNVDGLNPLFVKCMIDYDTNVTLPMARKISKLLYVKVKIDMTLFHVSRNHRILFRVMYPLVWLWWNGKQSFLRRTFPDIKPLDK